MRKIILVVDDDTYICNLLENYLEEKGFEAQGAFSVKKAKELITSNKFDLILCDYRLPDGNGQDVLEFTKNQTNPAPVIIMTAYAEISIAVKLIKMGAFDYITKPIQPEEILELVKKAQLKNTDHSQHFKKDFIEGKSEEIQKVMEHVQLVAPTEMTVLIEGETGSGKEYIARAIHLASKRKNKPFVAVDCGSIPKDLANSELFGHIKGAFTGAINNKKGYFEQAKGGTLFLDEVGNLPIVNQIKLLRALQEKIISRVGDNKSVKVDVRLIAATNENLKAQIEMGNFREDLYHRLNGFKIDLPALRQRGDDLMIFSKYFIDKANKSFNKNVKDLSKKSKELFHLYEWPGNIRELRNVINRSVLLSKRELLDEDSLPDEIRYCKIKSSLNKENSYSKNTTELKKATLNTEKEVITKALIECNFNKSKAAKMLDIDRKTLYNKINLYNIDLNR